MIAERDENTCRKAMTPSELVSLGRAVEALERPKSEERADAGRARGRATQQQTPDLVGRPGTPNQTLGHKTSDAVGEALGFSARSYERARHVVDTATDLSVPVAIRKVAQEAQRQMDAGGGIRPAYSQVRQAQRPPIEQRLPGRPSKLKGRSLDRAMANTIPQRVRAPTRAE